MNNEQFGKDWRETSFLRKVDICKWWVITRVVNKSRVSSPSHVEKTTAVYEAIDQIMQCRLNLSNKGLAEEVSAAVVEKRLRSVKAISVLEAVSRIERCGAVVQDCYKFHVNKALEIQGVKKSSMIPNEILNECSKTRYYIIYSFQTAQFS